MTAAGTEMSAAPSEVACASPSEDYLRLIPRDFARQHLIVSAGTVDGVEHLLVGARTTEAAIWNTGAKLQSAVTTEVVEEEPLARLIDETYSDQTGFASPSDQGSEAECGSETDLEKLLAEADKDLLSIEGKAPVVRLVDVLLFDAQAARASDLHIQPLADRVLVRYRIDGVLHLVRQLPETLAQPITSRIKVMGQMDIAERRTPQDGRASVTVGQGDSAKAIDLRISTLPTRHGERVVVRLLDTDRGLRLARLDQIGMPHDTLEAYRSAASQANGIVLLTGPTGSGKTTTLYATLRWVSEMGPRGGELNVMTIEDPVEYELSSAGIAISQAQVNTKKGVTFASGLRHILRQDPDIVMVGEIRDTETARTAIQASLTGHLVFSTLHTNDAISAVTRLIDLGVEPYLVGSSLTAVLAQRLVRTTHQACDGRGCESCFGSGFQGRTGLFELFILDDELRAMVSEGSSVSELRANARCRGMRSLGEEGERLLEQRLTTRLEIERVSVSAGAVAPMETRL